MRPVVQMNNANAGEDTGIGTTNQIIDKMEQNENERIGRRIAELRKERGLTQMQLAQKVGMFSNNLSRIESGKHAISITALAKIAKALDVKIELI